jgi:ribose-phosphate pyrophosphokinase
MGAVAIPAGVAALAVLLPRPTQVHTENIREDSLKRRKNRRKNMKIFACNGNPALAASIAKGLRMPLSDIEVGKFSDGETNIQIKESVRGDSCYIIQSTCPPVNDNIMELLLTVSALRRASAKYITAVIPYYGYKRDIGTGMNISGSKREGKQDENSLIGDMHGDGDAIIPISSAEVATMLEAMGVDRVLAVDLQAPGQGQIEGFFGTRVPVDSIQGTFAAVEYFRNRMSDRLVVVAPNETCVKKAEHMQAGLRGSGYRWRDGSLRKMKVGLAICLVGGDVSGGSRYHYEMANADGTTEMDEVSLVGNVENCDVIIVDDMIASGGTIVSRAKQLRAAGARRIYVFATHGLFCDDALEQIGKAVDVHEVVVTDTVPLPVDYDRRSRGKVVQVSIATIIADTLNRMHRKESLRDSMLTVYDPEGDNHSEGYHANG